MSPLPCNRTTSTLALKILEVLSNDIPLHGQLKPTANHRITANVSKYIELIESLLLQGAKDVGKASQGPKLQSLDNSTWKTLNDVFHNKHVFRPLGANVIALRLFHTIFPMKEGKIAVKLLLRSNSTSHYVTACISSLLDSRSGHIWSSWLVTLCLLHWAPIALQEVSQRRHCKATTPSQSAQPWLSSAMFSEGVFGTTLTILIWHCCLKN